MTKETIKTAIEATFAEHGFTANYDNWHGWLPYIPQGDEDYISISIREIPAYNKEGHSLDYTITAYASVCRMNANSDTAELFRAAGQIKHGAELVDAINALNLKWRESLKQADVIKECIAADEALMRYAR